MKHLYYLSEKARWIQTSSFSLEPIQHYFQLVVWPGYKAAKDLEGCGRSGAHDEEAAINPPLPLLLSLTDLWH